MTAALDLEGTMGKKLHLSPGLKLPHDAVTETIGLLGQRGSGKTTTASVLVEELLKAHLPVEVIDPTGAWWGLRSSRDGKGDGYPVTVLGGDHGDLPLEETAGKVVADLIAEEAPPLILDLSHFSKGAMRRFATDLFERLYEKNRRALHVIVDEADLFAPQKIQKGQERLFGAIDEIVRRGRIRGLGMTMVCQRSAALNKDILSQCSTLVAHRASHPRDLDPVLEWMKVHADAEQLREVHGSIAKLANGEAWVMSPQWLDVFARVQMRDRETFNSSATPKAGERRVVPKRLAPVDLTRLTAAMAETIERAKRSDPTHLQRRVAELERDLAKERKTLDATAAVAQRRTVEKRVEVPALKDGEIARLEKAIERLSRAEDAAADRFRAEVQKIEKGLSSLVEVRQSLVLQAMSLRQELARALGAPPAPPPPRPFVQPALDRMRGKIPGMVQKAVATALAAPRAPKAQPPGDGEVPRASMRVLEVLARNRAPMTRAELGVVAGYQASAGSFGNLIYALTGAGLAVKEGDAFVPTAAGLALLGGEVPPRPTPDEILARWRPKATPASWQLVELILERGPMTRQELGDAAQKVASAGSFGNTIYALTGPGVLVRQGDGRFAVSPVVLEGGTR